MSRVMVLNSDDVLGLSAAFDLLCPRHLAQLDVGPEAARLGEHLEAGLGIGAEALVALGGLEQLEGLGHVELVGGEVVGDRRGVLAPLHVRARSGRA